MVITEAGFSKRTTCRRVPPDRGTKGVKTITFTDAKGLLAAALSCASRGARVHLPERHGQRTGVRGINRYGRAQGVKVMNPREGDEVSAVALVVETEAEGAAGRPVSGTDGVIAAGVGDGAEARRRASARTDGEPEPEPWR